MSRKHLLVSAFLLLLAIGAGAVYLTVPLCHDLACARRYDGWFAQKFDASPPLYLTAMDKSALLKNTHVPGVEERLDAILAYAPQNGRIGVMAASCAVVGNSSNLRGSHYGHLIDQHAYVFRMNKAPTKGYADDVGTRTTFHVLHPWVPLEEQYDKRTIHLVVSLGAINSNQTALQQLEDMYLGASPDYSRLRIINLDFIRYVNQVWFAPNVKPGEDKVPSIGFNTVIIALHMCQKVDLFGFSAPNNRGIWEHYFEKRDIPVPMHHHPDFQQRFLENMARRGIITLYSGNPHS